MLKHSDKFASKKEFHGLEFHVSRMGSLEYNHEQ